MSEINYTKELPGGFFPINLKIIDQHQQKDPSLMAKYTTGTYQKGYFCVESNIKLNLITCDDTLVSLPIIQSCVLYW